MTESTSSPSSSSSTTPHDVKAAAFTCSTATAGNNSIPEIPVEIVTEEEMAMLEAALAAAARSYLSSSSSSYSCIPAAITSPARSSLFRDNARSIQKITALSKRSLSAGFGERDIEDSGDLRIPVKKNKVAADSLFNKYRRKWGLSVTDITGAEWCEKQTEFAQLFSKRKVTKAMKAGKARHVKLELEVVKRVKAKVHSVEDRWAMKFIDFIVGANQLLFDGLTRELPLIGFAEGVWITGIIDEIRVPEGQTNKNPILVDTKTRDQATLPAEPQRRNGKLQLMCYKLLWDKLVAGDFPSVEFFSFFSLNPYNVLSAEIRENAAKEGLSVLTLEDMVRCYRNTCGMLLPADDHMLLRYELQKDNSVLEEDQFAYDPDWLKSQLQGHLWCWLGEREARYTSREERWKCRFCQFASVCPINTSANTASSPVKANNSGSYPT